MTDIQLSANTIIDNDVLNFTEHQIEFLRAVASKPSFQGLAEPDLNKSRKRGVVVVSWWEGTHQQYAHVGLYRTLGWPQSQQFRTLRNRSLGTEEQQRVMQALGTFTFRNEKNDTASIEAALDKHINLFNESRRMYNAADSSMDPREVVRAAFFTARMLIIYGNNQMAKFLTETLDKGDEVKSDE